MNKSSLNYQGELLNEARKDSVPVTIFLTNGFQIKGVIRAFDNYVIMMESEGRQQMIYKHAISTIAPIRAIRLNYNHDNDEVNTETEAE